MEFPSLHWSQPGRATLQAERGAQAALAEFYRRYREPVIYFLKRRGVVSDKVEDVAYGFFLHLIEKFTLARADMTRGRFRTFLLEALVRFLGDARDREQAAKRGGSAGPPSLDAEENSWASSVFAAGGSTVLTLHRARFGELEVGELAPPRWLGCSTSFSARRIRPDKSGATLSRSAPPQSARRVQASHLWGV